MSDPHWTEAQTALWNRIQAFVLDEPHVDSKFSARLSRENRWSRKFTRRVIEEYRRFAFLFVAAGHPVSPSEIVDQAWHLHLIYTRSYWEEFCGTVLGRPMHHLPSVGGAAEQAKLADSYMKTWQSYERLFGESPPTDIWPTPAERETEKLQTVHVDAARFWIVPKPLAALNRKSLAAVMLLFVIATVIGCAPIWVPPAIGPLNLPGKSFLVLYVSALLGATGIGFAWRLWLRGLFEPAQPIPELNPYEVAYLAGGERRVVNAAITSLVARNHLQVTSNSLMQAEPLFKESDLIEHRIWEAVGDSGELDDVHKQMRAQAGAAAERLEEHRLVLTSAESWGARLYPAIPLGLLLLLGFAKIAIGVDRGRPVGFLVVLSIVTAIIALIFVCRRPIRTCQGDAHFKKLKAQHRDLESHPEAAAINSQMRGELESQQNPMRHAALAGSAVWPLAFALYGPQALADGPMDDLKKAFMPYDRNRGGDGCSTGCSSGGGGGDGGGCGGGGGGGGGGCGGCGGGGGD